MMWIRKIYYKPFIKLTKEPEKNQWDLLKYILNLNKDTHFGRNHNFGVTSLSVNTGQGFFMEGLCTGLLMFVILLVTRKENNIYGIAIGGTVFISALLIGDYTGGSLNPARSLGPALISGDIKDILFYIFAPITGSMISTRLYLKN